MFKNALISVVMPVFNSQQDLRVAIESILCQTYANFEFLIVDDGSTDASLNIIHSFSDSRIRLIKQPKNMGLVAALNRGISESRGDFVARMDADDISSPDRFELQLKKMQGERLDICGSNWRRIAESGAPLEILRAPLAMDEIVATLATTVPFAHGSALLRKFFLVENSLMYTQGYGEDYSLWIKCLQAGAKFGNVDKVLYFHRKHRLSITHLKQKEQAEAAKKLRRSFVKSNLHLCQDSLGTLSSRFVNLSNQLQVHTLYLAFRVFIETGNRLQLINLFVHANLKNRLKFFARVINA